MRFTSVKWESSVAHGTRSFLAVATYQRVSHEDLDSAAYSCASSAISASALIILNSFLIKEKGS